MVNVEENMDPPGNKALLWEYYGILRDHGGFWGFMT